MPKSFRLQHPRKPTPGRDAKTHPGNSSLSGRHAIFLACEADHNTGAQPEIILRVVSTVWQLCPQPRRIEPVCTTKPLESDCAPACAGKTLRKPSASPMRNEIDKCINLPEEFKNELLDGQRNGGGMLERGLSRPVAAPTTLIV